MTPQEFKSFMSRYHLKTPKLAALLGLTANYIHQLRCGRHDPIPAHIATAVKEIAAGHYKKKSDGLDDRTRNRLEGQMQPYLQRLTKDAHGGHYQFFES
ncbi:MAG: hypothetical protein IMF11_17360 [Proteobacteria bacterium]|nr:hypothetical protein [Pseudomonadota bacterium]